MKKLILAVMVASLIGCGGGENEDNYEAPPVVAPEPEPNPSPNPNPDDPVPETPDPSLPNYDHEIDQSLPPPLIPSPGDDDVIVPDDAAYVGCKLPYYVTRVFEGDFTGGVINTTFPIQVSRLNNVVETPMGITVDLDGRQFKTMYKDGFKTDATNLNHSFKGLNLQLHGFVAVKPTKEFLEKIAKEAPQISLDGVVENPDGSKRASRALLQLPFNGPIEIIDEDHIRLIGITYKAGFIDEGFDGYKYGTGFWDDEKKVMNVYSGIGYPSEGWRHEVTIKEIISETEFTYAVDGGEHLVSIRPLPIYPIDKSDRVGDTSTLKEGSFVRVVGSEYNSTADVYLIK